MGDVDQPDEDEKRTGLFWWIDRWRKSTAYTDMTLQEQGAYRNLIDELKLRDGLIPFVERTLARASGGETEWPAVREAVLRKFDVVDVDGARFLRHRTHDRINGKDRFKSAQTRKGEQRAAGAERDGDGRFKPKTPAGSQPDQPDGPAHGPAGEPAAPSLPDPESVSGSVSGTSPQPPASGGPGSSEHPSTPVETEAARLAGLVAQGKVTMASAVLTLVQPLSAAWIDAGGLADRDVQRSMKRALQARGLVAGTQAVLAGIEERRAESAAAEARRRAGSAVMALVDRARASGRDGRAEWAEIRAALEREMDQHRFYSWIRPLRPRGIVSDDEGDRLLVEAWSEEAAAWLGANYQSDFATAVSSAGLALSVVVVVLPNEVSSAGLALPVSVLPETEKG
jgi:hypothetical protein